MIRRDQLDAAGQGLWMLIPQAEHARLAGQLAGHWGAAPPTPPWPREMVVPAILRHDDGWAQWEREPDVDEQTGRPLSFTEMPLAEAHAIWRRSIGQVAELGPLAQYMVAGHFADLRRGSEEADKDESVCFLREQDSRCTGWLEDWQRQDSLNNTIEAARRALQLLQMLDAVSLWLCCTEPVQPHETALPGETVVTFTPLTPQRIVVTPWPLTTPSLALQVSGHSVPAARYNGRQALQQAESRPETLRWEFTPG